MARDANAFLSAGVPLQTRRVRRCASEPFTVSLPHRALGSPRGYCPLSRHDGMGDFWVIVGIIAFVILMFGLIKGLDRI
jgi:hypothetical protein